MAKGVVCCSVRLDFSLSCLRCVCGPKWLNWGHRPGTSLFSFSCTYEFSSSAVRVSASLFILSTWFYHMVSLRGEPYFLHGSQGPQKCKNSSCWAFLRNWESVISTVLYWLRRFSGPAQI